MDTSFSVRQSLGPLSVQWSRPQAPSSIRRGHGATVAPSENRTSRVDAHVVQGSGGQGSQILRGGEMFVDVGTGPPILALPLYRQGTPEGHQGRPIEHRGDLTNMGADMLDWLELEEERPSFSALPRRLPQPTNAARTPSAVLSAVPDFPARANRSVIGQEFLLMA